MANVPFFFESDRKVFFGSAASRTTALAVENPGAYYQEIGGLLYQSNGVTWEIFSSGGGTMASSAFASGTLPDATPVEVAMAGAPLPCTVILDSSDGTRKIQWSADGGVEYFDAVYDYTNANELVFIVDAPVTHIKFTGLTADTYRIG